MKDQNNVLTEAMIQAARIVNERSENERLYRDELNEAFKKTRIETKQCTTDDCDGSHCKTCGCHMISFYLESGRQCDSCCLIEEAIFNRYLKLSASSVS